MPSSSGTGCKSQSHRFHLRRQVNFAIVRATPGLPCLTTKNASFSACRLCLPQISCPSAFDIRQRGA